MLNKMKIKNLIFIVIGLIQYIFAIYSLSLYPNLYKHYDLKFKIIVLVIFFTFIGSMLIISNIPVRNNIRKITAAIWIIITAMISTFAVMWFMNTRLLKNPLHIETGGFLILSFWVIGLISIVNTFNIKIVNRINKILFTIGIFYILHPFTIKYVGVMIDWLNYSFKSDLMEVFTNAFTVIHIILLFIIGIISAILQFIFLFNEDGIPIFGIFYYIGCVITGVGFIILSLTKKRRN